MSSSPVSHDLPAELVQRMTDQLTVLYGADVAAATFNRLREKLVQFRAQHPRLHQQPAARAERLRAHDAMVITYGDQISEPDRPPLQTLAAWLHENLAELVSSVHILPFYPYSSDDGFSVIDYAAVDPALGDWSDIGRMSRHFKLMFDAVVNHISARSTWFQGFLNGDPRYADYFIVVDQAADLSGVTRPRTHPLLTRFETATGPHNVWTTFSTDQIDLNVRNPDVLLALIDVLLLYAAQGATYLRLDAVGYLWKTIGTRCIHLPETHTAVQIMRSVMDAAAPHVLLITETNVPHADNISYFGDGTNEAQLVYQFPLAPLVLHAFLTGSTRYLQQWAATLQTPSSHTTFFNFLASHDGIGVQPAKGILSEAEIADLVQMTLRHGGRVGYKTNSDGSQSAYELNITLMDALSDPATTPEAAAIDRFMSAQAIMLALQGLPGIYIHSLVGSRNDLEGMARTGHNRTINRQKWQRAELERELRRPDSRAARVLTRYKHLLRQRASSPAFDVSSPQQIVPSSDGVFAILRVTPDGSERVLCLHNVSGQPQTVALDHQSGATLHDLLSNTTFTAPSSISVPPYTAMWLRAQ